MKKALWVIAVVVAGSAPTWPTFLRRRPGQSTTTLGKALTAVRWTSGHAKQEGGGWRARLHTHGISDFYVIARSRRRRNLGLALTPGASLNFVVAGQVTNYLADDPSCTPHVYSTRPVVHRRGRGRRAHAPQQRHGAGRDDRGAVPAARAPTARSTSRIR